jgi:hypothetical protein
VSNFTAHAEANALRWQAGEYSLHEAVDELQFAAERDGLVTVLGQDVVQAIMARAFARARAPPQVPAQKNPAPGRERG